MPKGLFLRKMSSTTLLTAMVTTMMFTLISCSSNAPQTSKPKPATVKTQTLSASKLLELAKQASSPERESLILQAAQAYIENGKFSRARDLLVDMNADELPDQAYIKHTDLLSTLALQEGSNFLAHGILTKPRLEQQWSNMEPRTEVSLREKPRRFLRC
jgi:uncharacterized protein